MKKQITFAAALMTLISSAAFACEPDIVEVVCRAPGLEIKLTDEEGYIQQIQIGDQTVNNLNADGTDVDAAKIMSLAYAYNEANQRTGFNFSAQVDSTNLSLNADQVDTNIAITETGTFMKYNYETDREEETAYEVVQTTYNFSAVLNGTFQGQNLGSLRVDCSEVIIEDSRYHEEH